MGNCRFGAEHRFLSDQQPIGIEPKLSDPPLEGFTARISQAVFILGERFLGYATDAPKFLFFLAKNFSKLG
ncbi:hypothetical protein NNJEOMEG_03290 [Fundidesulfovibrio magnetotacticus]|uniref:Uncharacterized protein n=1 Tax=Fundidesulfovibrio magnetotacticus TaxID=2730080 RepID=A0A6V8M0P5_9BACT|nr:hypothetical protein NNJEOMEG_03290 [Fundidesulfovibrio magnetotacticus]